MTFLSQWPILSFFPHTFYDFCCDRVTVQECVFLWAVAESAHKNTTFQSDGLQNIAMNFDQCDLHAASDDALPHSEFCPLAEPVR